MKTDAQFLLEQINNAQCGETFPYLEPGKTAALRAIWQNLTKDFGLRLSLVAFCGTNQPHVFVATVRGRGFNGRQRTVLVEDIHPFGRHFVAEDHLWLPYTRLWERIEPFYQGWKVVLVGKAVAYTRLNGTVDYAIEPEHVTTLLSREQLNRHTSMGPSRTTCSDVHTDLRQHQNSINQRKEQQYELIA